VRAAALTAGDHYDRGQDNDDMINARLMIESGRLAKRISLRLGTGAGRPASEIQDGWGRAQSSAGTQSAADIVDDIDSNHEQETTKTTTTDLLLESAPIANVLCQPPDLAR
jgi:hypothetical protein